VLDHWVYYLAIELVCAWDCLTFVSRKRCKSEILGQLDKKCFVIFIRGTKRMTEHRNSRLNRLCGVPKGSYLDPRGWSSFSLFLSLLVLLTPVITRMHTRLYRPSFSRTFIRFHSFYVLYCYLNGARFVHLRKGRSYIHGDEDSSCIYLLIHTFSFRAFQHQIIFRLDIRR